MLWPSQIEAVLLKQGYQANYQILVDRIGNNDTIEVQVEMTPEMKQEDVAIAAREKKIVHGLKNMLGIKVDVSILEPKTITRSEGKAVRVVDKRNIINNLRKKNKKYPIVAVILAAIGYFLFSIILQLV